ncbi:MucR family transcriptional regulator [Methylobacterium symbioticum]|uniref:Transcriptional regulatory protein ros n=1 Tax=Methylobacterium symbioticum TaxID=2584084 RepID=A0A509EC99_9HYPH|nr:MucR family transcriptional regulator [Methylobacterium symbioticum]VUD71841.1 Transcriptional regulatory protein ros [Methylobacterium symbioticum]
MSDHVFTAAGLVAAYVTHNHVAAADLPALLGTVHRALAGLGLPAVEPQPEVEKPSPAEIRRSITDDYLTSFIDGGRYKTLRRHLRNHGLTPEGYRARYGLPPDYPMTSPGYSARRSELAKAIGLGQPVRQAAE